MFKKDDRVISRYSRKKGTVIEINNKWGWFLVRFDDKFERYYSSVAQDNNLSMLPLNELKKSQFAYMDLPECHCPGEECYCPERS